MKHQQRRSGGLTLVEVLATTVLLAIVAVVLLRSSAEPTEDAAFRSLVNELKALDARARVAARTGSPLSLSLDCNRHRLIAHARFGGETICEVALPEDTAVSLFRDGIVCAKAVLFDSCGTSCDYALDIRQKSRRARVEFAGLTGWSTTLETAP